MRCVSSGSDRRNTEEKPASHCIISRAAFIATSQLLKMYEKRLRFSGIQRNTRSVTSVSTPKVPSLPIMISLRSGPVASRLQCGVWMVPMGVAYFCERTMSAIVP